MGPFDHTIDVSLYYPCGVHEISPLQSIKTLEMGDENMEKRKFKVGDKIRIVSCVSSYNGKIATIIYFDGNDYRPYHVRVHETKNTIYLNPEEMELVEEKEMTGFELVMGKHVVETKKGSFYLLVKKDEERIISLNLDDPEEWVDFALDENLHDVEDNEFDIEKVYEYHRCGFSSIKNNLTSPVWERKHVKEMTIAEIEKELGYAIKVVKEKK